MESLLDKTRDLDENVFRNIVSLRCSESLFDDLTQGDPELESVAVAVEMQVKQNIPSDVIKRGFYYSMAIGYPFEGDSVMASRYSDGSFGVWYGSLTADTTIEETAYHMLRTEQGVEGINELVIRERAIYKVHCKALLLDLKGKQQAFPQLIQENYGYTQDLGKRLQREGHPGLLAPSARCAGTNVVIFNPAVLSHAHINHYLTYTYDPAQACVRVERKPGSLLKTITHKMD